MHLPVYFRFFLFCFLEVSLNCLLSCLPVFKRCKCIVSQKSCQNRFLEIPGSSAQCLNNDALDVYAETDSSSRSSAHSGLPSSIAIDKRAPSAAATFQASATQLPEKHELSRIPGPGWHGGDRGLGTGCVSHPLLLTVSGFMVSADITEKATQHQGTHQNNTQMV